MEPFRLSIGHRQLELLDWPLIQSRITQTCFFEHNKQAFKASPFLYSDQIETEYDRLDKVFSKLSELKQSFYASLQGCSSEESLFYEIFMLKKGKVLRPETANLAAHLLEAYELTSRHIPPQSVSNDEQIELKLLLRNFLKPVRRFLTQSGQVEHEKHPALSKVGQEIHDINTGLRKQIQNIIKSDQYRNVLQFEQYDIIDDRFVIPVRSDNYQAHLGQIVSRSQSGMTLLVEPPMLRELSNKRIQLLAKQEEILNQIFVQLSHVLTQHYSSFEYIIKFVERVDLLISKASFCEHLGLIRPEVTQSSEVFIKSFFHPLIEEAVVNDLSLKGELSGLVISGPNTGGKTVALKSLALCQVLMHSGLFLPAEKAALPLARAVYYFSHDQQDLSQGLSSFSSEAAQYIQLVENLEEKSFIFIDEIFNSTSSEEASALALGLLDYINEKHSSIKVFLSTHHQFLKTTMHADKNFLSCHVGYDFERNTPTYKLQYNSPGSSLALSIFEKLTDKSNKDLTSVYVKAQSYLNKKQMSYEGLLEKLSSQKTELDQKIQEANQLRQELKNQKKSSDGILYLEREKIKDQYREKLENAFKEAQSWIKNFKEEIKTSKNISKGPQSLEKQKIKYHGLLQKDDDKSSALKFNADGKSIDLKDVQLGAFYFCALTNSEVVVSKVNERKKQVQVKNKGITFWVPLSSLAYAKNKRRPPQSKVQVMVNKSNLGRVKIDGRGMRLEEFQKEVLPSLDEVLCGDIPYLTIVHGHGDGVLKKWLREHLSYHNTDFDWGPDEGNDGSTTIKVSY